MENGLKFYTRGEEIANVVTHGIGTLFAIAGLVLLILFSSSYGDDWYTVSYTVYGITLVVLYLESTLYHGITNKKIKALFRIFDHSSIYLLIAGTYTPFTLTVLRGKIGWTIFITVWTLAIAGIVLKFFFVGKFKVLSTIMYVVMGWMIIFAIKPLMAVVPHYGLVLLFAGGIFYTVGAVLYLLDKIPYNHAVWHMFVLGGSTCHFFCILFYLFPKVV
ncbi:MAG: PAQR family membrane homeostasis protein TrhA [Solirubrobacterales bacterium]